MIKTAVAVAFAAAFIGLTGSTSGAFKSDLHMIRKRVKVAEPHLDL